MFSIRDKSNKKALNYGLPINPQLPLLDDDFCLHTKDDIIARALCLNCTIHAAYKYPKHKSLEWLDKEGLLNSLTQSEKIFLEGGFGSITDIRIQAEGLWIIVWVLSFIEKIDFMKECTDKLAFLMPNIIKSEDSMDFRNSAKLRTMEEILQELDLSYVLHWAIRQTQLEGKKIPKKLKYHVVYERRRALEWLVSDEEWDEISLDT